MNRRDRIGIGEYDVCPNAPGENFFCLDKGRMISDAHVVFVRVCSPASALVSIRSMQVYLLLSLSISVRRPFNFAISGCASNGNDAGCRLCRDTCVNFLVELLSFLPIHICQLHQLK